MDLTYDVTNQSEFAGVTLKYDDFSTPEIEFEDLSALGSLIVGLTAPAGTQVKVEIEDADGNRDFVILNNVGTTEQFYEIPFSAFFGVDFTKIRFINFIIDHSLVTSFTGTLELRTDGLQF